jgi:surfactin synthase thioesterase subunit
VKYAPKRSVANCAQELLEALAKYRTGDAERHRPVIFIGHSFGGIVVKEVIS